MPTRTYIIDFQASGAQVAIAGIQSLMQATKQLTTAAQQAGPAVGAVGTHSQEAAASADRLASRLAAVHVAMTAVGTVGDVIGSLGAALESAEKHAEKVAKHIQSMRDDMRELANLKGEAAPGDKTMADVLKFRMNTLTTEQEALKFSEVFESDKDTALRKGNIRPGGKVLARDATDAERGKYEADQRKLLDEIKEETAMAAVRTGLDPDAAMMMATGIMNSRPITSRKDFAESFGVIFQNLNEGQGKLKPFAQSLTRLASSEGMEGGRLDDWETASSLLAVASTREGNKPQIAQTHLAAGIRELFKFSGAQGKYLKSLGITPEMDFMEAAHLLKAETDKAKGEGKNITGFLESKGFRAAKGGDEVVYLMNNLDVADQMIRRNKDQRTTLGADFQRRNREFQGSQAGLNRRGAMMKDIGEDIRGIEREQLQSMRDMAEGEMEAKGEINTQASNFVEDIQDQDINLGIFKVPNPVKAMLGSSRRRKIDQRAAEMAVQQAEAVGLGNDPMVQELRGAGTWGGAMFGGVGGRQTDVGPERMAAIMHDLIPRIQEATGNKAGDNEGTKHLRRLVELSEKRESRESSGGGGGGGGGWSPWAHESPSPVEPLR